MTPPPGVKEAGVRSIRGQIFTTHHAYSKSTAIGLLTDTPSWRAVVAGALRPRTPTRCVRAGKHADASSDREEYMHAHAYIYAIYLSIHP